MDEAAFWRLIARLNWRHDGDDDKVVEPVVRELAKRPREDVEAFEEILARKLYAIDGRAWAREMGDGWWGGEDNVSVDAFLYSRCAVVAGGREFYEQVLADPTTMPKDMEFEALLFVASTAWERKTGEEAEDFEPSVSYETFSNAAGWPPAPAEPVVARHPEPHDSAAYLPPVRLETGREAVRRLIRSLVTGDRSDPVLSAYLEMAGQVVVMTPGSGVDAPPEDAKHRFEGGPGPEWRARIRLWAAPPGDSSSRQPTGLVAVIRLHRVSPDRVEGELVAVEPETR